MFPGNLQNENNLIVTLMRLLQIQLRGCMSLRAIDSFGFRLQPAALREFWLYPCRQPL